MGAGGPYSGLMLVSDIAVFTKPYSTHMFVRTSAHTRTHTGAHIWNQTEHSRMLQTDRQTCGGGAEESQSRQCADAEDISHPGLCQLLSWEQEELQNLDILAVISRERLLLRCSQPDNIWFFLAVILMSCSQTIWFWLTDLLMRTRETWVSLPFPTPAPLYING